MVKNDGYYSFDKVPQLKKHSFAIVYSAPSNDRGEHYIMTARLDKTYFLLTLWEERDQLTPF